MENQSYPPFSIIHQRTDERNISRYPSGSYQGATEEHRPDIGGFPSFLSFQSTTNPAGPLELVKLATHIHPTEPLAAAAAHHGTMAIPNPAGQIEGALARPSMGHSFQTESSSWHKWRYDGSGTVPVILLVRQRQVNENHRRPGGRQ